MNRGALLAERRSRLLAAVRQTYNDLFHDAFIDSGQIYALRTASDRALDDLGSPAVGLGQARAGDGPAGLASKPDAESRRLAARFAVGAVEAATFLG